MQDIEEVVRYIKDEISKQAEAECKVILSEADELKATSLKELHKDVEKDAKMQLDLELAEIQSNASIAISRSNVDRTKKLIAKRDEYTASVFQLAKSKLDEFVMSHEYESFMNDKASKLGQINTTDQGVFYLREADSKLAEGVKKAYGKDCRIEISKKIIIGGFIYENTTKKTIADETLDTALENQKEWFANHSGLIIQ